MLIGLGIIYCDDYGERNRKLKKLLVSCVLIAAMGITLTGCSFNIGNILNENSSDVIKLAVPKVEVPKKKKQ